MSKENNYIKANIQDWHKDSKVHWDRLLSQKRFETRDSGFI